MSNVSVLKVWTHQRPTMNTAKLPLTLSKCLRLFNGKSILTTLTQGFHISTSVSHQSSDETLKKRQVDMMAKGLPKKRPITGVKHVLLVASGKGGVGKSTTAVNIATGLKLLDPSREVGLLDADVFGPSVPLMMNLDDTPFLNDNDLMIPLINYGVKCMSMGFLVNKDSPVIWRGLMVMQALDRLLRQVTWDPLDYLVIDTPPGTGDTHLSLVQNIPVSGVVLVTTPQMAALQVTQRGANMFRKLNIPIVGIVQNMSSVKCPNCQSQVHLHSKSAEAFLKDLAIPILENIPIDNKISQGADDGIPVVVSSQDSPEAKSYRNIALKIINFLNEEEDRRQT